MTVQEKVRGQPVEEQETTGRALGTVTRQKRGGGEECGGGRESAEL